jgi:hypothetical protein
MADAVALNRKDLFDWSVAMYRTAARQIDADGYLPNELRRQSRALEYHNFALEPLVMIAAFAKANGLDLLPENNGALQRLATRTLQGFDDPQVFAARAGEKQVWEDWRSAWLRCGRSRRRAWAATRPSCSPIPPWPIRRRTPKSRNARRHRRRCRPPSGR